jgi:hypothetical protein
MAQTNYTPISLYYSATASNVPTAANLVPGELAINTADGKLYYEDSAGVVQVLATKSTGSIGGSNTQVQYNNAGSLAGSANLTFDGTNLTTGGSETAARFIPSGSTVATNGMYLQSANTLSFSTNSTLRATIDATGNLGLGVTPSASTLFKTIEIGTVGNTIAGRSGNSTLVMGANWVYNSGFKYANNGTASQYETTGGAHYWYNATSGTAGNAITFTQAMTLDASGNLLVGTTSGVSKLDVRSTAGELGRFAVTNAGESYLLVGAGSSTTEGLRLTYDNSDGSSTINNYYNASLKFKTNNTLRMIIDLNGIVAMNAYGAGAATFNASGVISSVSDENWKTKDGVPTNPDVMLQKLEPGYWFYNEEKAPIYGQDRQLGFYAQNVHEAIGNEAAPTPEEGKPWGYYDRSVLAIAVMSLKNALNTIEELKQRITVLENK